MSRSVLAMRRFARGLTFQREGRWVLATMREDDKLGVSGTEFRMTVVNFYSSVYRVYLISVRITEGETRKKRQIGNLNAF